MKIGKIIQKHHKQFLSAQNYHQTTIVAWSLLTSDAIRRQIVKCSPFKAKSMFHNNYFIMFFCEIAWFPQQPIMLFKRMWMFLQKMLISQQQRILKHLTRYQINSKT